MMLTASIIEEILGHAVISAMEEGSLQGGDLFPLLANVYLNEFDQELPLIQRW